MTPGRAAATVAQLAVAIEAAVGSVPALVELGDVPGQVASRARRFAEETASNSRTSSS